MTTITTVTSLRRNGKTIGYSVENQFVAWNGNEYSCSCGKRNCEHSQAVIASIKSDREARIQHDKEVAALAQAKREQARREAAPLNYRQEGFSLLRK